MVTSFAFERDWKKTDSGCLHFGHCCFARGYVGSSERSTDTMVCSLLGEVQKVHGRDEELMRIDRGLRSVLGKGTGATGVHEVTRDSVFFWVEEIVAAE